MSNRASRPCKHGGCRQVASGEGRFCPKHSVDPVALRPYDRWRGSPASRGYDADWRRVRLIALRRDSYLCQACLKQKRAVAATEVHHIVPIDVDPTLRLVLDNLISLCKPCHSAITATRDSTFALRRANQM